MESLAILEGNLIPIYALLLHITQMEGCTEAGSLPVQMGQ